MADTTYTAGKDYDPYKTWLESQNYGKYVPDMETIENSKWNPNDPRYGGLTMSRADMIAHTGLVEMYRNIYKLNNQQIGSILSNLFPTSKTTYTEAEATNAFNTNFGQTAPMFLPKLAPIWKKQKIDMNLSDNPFYIQSPTGTGKLNTYINDTDRRWAVVANRSSDLDKQSQSMGTYSDTNPYAQFLKRAETTGA